MAKKKGGETPSVDEMLAQKAAEMGLDPGLPSDEMSQKIRFQQAQRQAEADERKRRRRG